ncbi:MAG: transcription antitermination factor NusB, partial [Spirochaetales bacterium]|nr:transcription antitermination factor NusB [Spirochaetales bacterium]MCF7939377.1 transcription antitermination factor NusB [Spirochaetales bacterium]
AWDITSYSLEESLELRWLEDEQRLQLDEDTLTFARLLIAGTIEHIDEIDALINRHLEHWDFRRLARVDLAVIRMSAFALLYQKDIPETVTINEAVEISKDFGSDDSYRFVNGLLDGIKQEKKDA